MNIKNKLSSINSKTLIYLIAFSVTIIVLLWFFQSMFLNIFYQRHQLRNINSIASTIIDTEPSRLPSVLESIAYEQQVCIQIVDIKTNQSINFNTMMNGCLLGKANSSIEKYMQEIIDSSESIVPYKLTNKDYEVKALLTGVKNENFYVFIFSNLEDINVTSSIIKGQLVYITAIAILFATLIAYFLSHKITDPIAKITKKTKRFAKGEYSLTFEKNGITEIDELADTLNYVGEEFSKTDQMRRDLMANVSHDLKTPLTMIKAYTEMIRDISHKDEKKRNKHLQIIIEETNRLNILVNDILELSKIQADAEKLTVEDYDLAKEINTIIKRYEIIKETEDYVFEVNVPKKCKVCADKNKINQVIYNLINNAINYTGLDKKITINVIEEKTGYLVEIIDTGKGIKETDILHIWDKYYKNDKNHQRNVVGTGLGLAIVKGVLEAHNFEYGVKSKKNNGSRFYFKIKKCK